MEYYHKHHIIPKHAWKRLNGSLKGVNDSSNIEILTINEHANKHYERWIYCGEWEDYVAWKVLSGQITVIEAKKIIPGFCNKCQNLQKNLELVIRIKEINVQTTKNNYINNYTHKIGSFQILYKIYITLPI